MAISARYARQDQLGALITCLFSDLPSGTFVPMVELPRGALIISAELIVETASNAGTTDVITIGTSAAPTSYLTTANFKATGRTAFTTVGAGLTTAQTTLGFTRTAVGTAATTGEVSVRVSYVIKGLNDQNYGDLS